MEEIIFISIVIVCFLGFMSIFLMLCGRLKKQLRMAKVTNVNVACAGSVVAGAPNNVKIQNFDGFKLYDNEGGLINTNEYDKFWVKGGSMLLCGIRDNDLLLTRRVSVDDVDFGRPHVFVLRRDDEVCSEAVLHNDMANYKVRRTWAVINMGEDNYVEAVRNIMKTESFVSLRNQNPAVFLSESDMIDDFMTERVRKYMVRYPECENMGDENHKAIISTTLKVSDGNRVTFSIHPARIIEGEVVYAYHM